VIKLVALSNAGGVAGTLTVLGATVNCSKTVGWFGLPLGFFAFGVVAAILYSANIYLRLAKDEGFEPDPVKWMVSDLTARLAGYGGIALFIAGCVSGILIIASI